MSPEQVAGEFGVNLAEVRAWEAGRARPPERIVRTLELVGSFARPAPGSESRFDFIDLFAGIGGLRRGFEPLGGRCVFTSEWDRYSQETYRANHRCDHEVAGDITKVPLGEIPGHDLLLAGFPCQPFSIAGVFKKNALNRPHGFRCEAQGTLFFNVAQIIEHHRPRAFLFDNGKNLVDHNWGLTFRRSRQEWFCSRRQRSPDFRRNLHRRLQARRFCRSTLGLSGTQFAGACRPNLRMLGQERW